MGLFKVPTESVTTPWTFEMTSAAPERNYSRGGGYSAWGGIFPVFFCRTALVNSLQELESQSKRRKAIGSREKINNQGEGDRESGCEQRGRELMDGGCLWRRKGG